MATFSNTIKVNTQGAVTALNKLDAALLKTTSRMRAFKQVANDGFGKGFDDVAASAAKAAKAGQDATDKIGKGAQTAAKNVRGIGLSFQDIGRIIQSQIIFSAINGITQGFSEAADAAAEFQLQVSRIAAIDESDLGFSGLREQIEELAQDLGRPLEEVGGAAFEALQNDLGTTEETFGILRKEAQELALVTGGDLTQAVNALSSVYKTFGKNAEAVNGISGQFFGTINAGRITLADLESSLGTLSPLATSIGVSFKELTDSLATITLTGTKANVATTQLRNVFNKLIKPTKALQQVYQDLGVRGFEDLSKKSGGFVKALQRLQKEVGNDEQELAKLFNTIRANVGVLNVLTDNTKLYEDTARRSAESAQRLGEAIKGIEGTAAREAAKNAAELEVIFTRIGDKALVLKNAVVDAFLFVTQGSEDAALGIGALTIALGGATTAVLQFEVAAATAFPPVIAFIGIVAGGVGALKVIEGLAEGMHALARETQALEVERLKTFINTLKELEADKIADAKEQLENTDSVLNRITRSAIRTGEEISKAFNIDSSNIQATEAALLEAFGDARNRVLKQIESAIDDIDKKILEGTRNLRGIQQEIADTEFEFSLDGLTKGEQAARRLQRSAELIGKAYKDIANVGLGDESERAARESAKNAVSEANAALSAARRGGSEAQIAEAKRNVLSALKTEEALEKRLLDLRDNLSKKALVDQQKAFERLSAEAKDQVQDVLDARKAIADAELKGASEEEVNRLRDGLVEEVKEARAALKAAGEAEALKTFELDEQFDEAISQLQKGLDETQIDWINAINNLRTQLSEAKDLKATVQLTANIAELANESGSEALQKAVQDAIDQGGLPGEVTQNAANAVLKTYEEQLKLQGQVEQTALRTDKAAEEARLKFFDARNELNSGSLEANKLVEPVLAQLDKLGDLNKEELDQLITNLKAALPAIAEQSTGLFGTFTEEQKANLTAGVKAAIEAATATAEGLEARKLFDPANLEAAKAVLDRISSENIQDLGLEVDSQGFIEVNDALEELDRQAAAVKKQVALIGTDAALQAVTGIRGVATVTNGLVTAAGNAQSAYQRLLDIAKEALATAKEAAALNASNNSGGTGTGGDSFFGGRRMLFRNAGGGTRGQDTLPTMLSPGEFVTSAKATRKFFPQLQAMNSGNAPVASDSVGDTNITIGDINVNSTSDVPSQTARDISLALKRELRRGTS